MNIPEKRLWESINSKMEFAVLMCTPGFAFMSKLEKERECHAFVVGYRKVLHRCMSVINDADKTY